MNTRGKRALWVSGALVALTGIAIGGTYGYEQWRQDSFKAIALNKIQEDTNYRTTVTLRNVKVYERNANNHDIYGEFAASNEAGSADGYQRFVVTHIKRFHDEDPPIVVISTEKDGRFPVGYFDQEWAQACVA